MPSSEHMMERQSILANFGEFALRCNELDDILAEACRLIQQALQTDFAKVLEIEPAGETLLVKAGVGWKPGVVGNERISMSDRSSEAYSIEVAEPVISNDISAEERFEFAQFLKDHGVRALVNVPIFLPGGKAYGLLQVDAKEPRAFSEGDTEFLRTYAMLLGPVIDRLHKSHSLREALDRNERLFRELQHRVKNHIAIMSSVVYLRSRQAESAEAREALRFVGDRIEALRLVHEQMYSAKSAEQLRLRPYIMQLIENLCHLRGEESGKVRLEFAIEEAELSPDKAVPLGLIASEFVTNSLKYAFNGRGGMVRVAIAHAEKDRLRVRLSDDGPGLPARPQDRRDSGGSGLKMIEAFSRQIGAEPQWKGEGPGTCLTIEFDQG